LGFAVACNGAHALAVAGRTDAAGWAAGGYDATYNGGGGDGFVVRMQDSAMLQVWVEPIEALLAGAQWRLPGDLFWHDVWEVGMGVPAGMQTVEFKPLDGWITAPSQAVLVGAVGLATVTGTYTQQHGDLCVTLEPAEAAAAGAQWRYWGSSTWQASGATVSVPAGSLTLEFKDADAWNTPSIQTVRVNADSYNEARATYTPATGALRVTLAPAEAVAAGAQWRLAGSETWLASGATTTGLAVGAHTVEFSKVANWSEPAAQAVTVSKNQTAYFSGSYVRDSGTLQVNIAPPEAAAAGARWQRAGTSSWLAGGAVESAVPTGPYDIQFLDLPYWSKPANLGVTIAKGDSQLLTGTYTRLLGSLQVTLAPPEAVAAGARWRRAGTEPWLASGATESGVPSGPVSLEFSVLDQWVRPSGVTATVAVGGVTTASAAYQVAGQLRVDLAPAAAVAAGAQWRRVGTTPWLASGATEAGILTGPCQVEFKEIAGWGVPARKNATISGGTTTTPSAVYPPVPAGMTCRLTLAAAALTAPTPSPWMARAISMWPAKPSRMGG
jgi:hypothetical protein